MTRPTAFLGLVFSLAGALVAHAQEPAPIPLPIAVQAELSSWRIDGEARGALPIGNGRVFAALGLGSRACELSALSGPRYDAGDTAALGEGAFGGVTVELVAPDGRALPLESRRVARVRDRAAVAAEDQSAGVALRMLAFTEAEGTRLLAALAVDGDGRTGLRLRVRTARAARSEGDSLLLDAAGDARLRLQLAGAVARDGALELALDGNRAWRGVLALSSAAGDPPAAASPSLDDARTAFEAMAAQWQRTLARTPSLESDLVRFVDLVREARLALLTQRCAHSGAILPMLGRRVYSLRTQTGALPALLRLGLHAEAKALLDLTWNAVRASGRLTEELPLRFDQARADAPAVNSAEFWRTVPMPPAELPSLVLLQHFWYWRATRDLGPIDEHWLMIDACLKRPVRSEDSLMPFSGNEPWSPAQLHAHASAVLGDDPRLFGESSAMDHASWSFASGVLFMISVQAYGELADARDQRARAAQWQAGKPSDAPSHALLKRSIALMQDIEKRFWIADLARFAPAVSPVDGKPVREALANANLLPLWIGWTFPTGERSRDNLRSTLETLWQDGVRVGTTRTVPIASGDLIGMLLVALSERDDARRLEVVDDLIAPAAPAGSWADWVDGAGRPLDRDGDGPSRPVLADPGTSGVNLDALLFALTGIRHVIVPNWDDDDIRLELRLPHGADFVSLRNAQKDGRTLDIFFRRSRSKMTEDERKANDEASADRRRDPELEYERLRFVVELIAGTPREGFYHADIDAMGTMFVRFLKPGAPEKPEDHDFRRIEEMEFSKADSLVFLGARQGRGAALPLPPPDSATGADTLALSCRNTFANAVRGPKVTLLDTGSPRTLEEMAALLLDGEKPRHAHLLIDWRHSAPPPAQWNDRLWSSPAWSELLERYRRAGGIVDEPGFVREARIGETVLRARDDGALVVPAGDTAITLHVPLNLPANRETALRVGSSVGFAVRANEHVFCSGKGRAPAAPDREAALFRLAEGVQQLVVELEASPGVERVIFLRLARPDGLPLR